MLPVAEDVQECEEQGFGGSRVKSLPEFGVVTLYDLLQFYADVWFECLSQLNANEMLASREHRETFALPSYVEYIKARLEVMEGHALYHGFSSIESQCIRMTAYLSGKEAVTCGPLRDQLMELRRRCEDEFGSHFFIHLEKKRAEEYRKPIGNDWRNIVKRFPKVRFNVGESGKCFALERYGASVFHILLVAEYGVIEIARLLGAEGDKPGWGSLKRLNDILSRPYDKRSDLEQKHSKMLEHVVPLATVVKDNWRHKMEHVDNQIVWIDTDFSPNVADEIIKATRGFMRKLAVELPK